MTMADGPGSYQKLREEGQYHIGGEPLNITFNEIGKRGQRRLDGYEKATGKALYTRDMHIPGMLYARVLRSPYAHAKIKLMDTGRAERLPGVRAILRFDDPEIKGRDLNGSYFAQGWARPKLAGWALKPVHLVLADEAWYEGQPMGAAIVAESEAIAQQALSLIHIEWEELPFILDQEEALKPDAPILRPGAESNEIHDPRKYYEVGDVKKGFQTADQIIEFKARRRPHLWAGAEMPSVLVRWLDDRLEMWVHQQQPYIAKQLIAEWLNVPMDKVTVNTVYQGCSFGGRGNPANHSENGINVLAALLSKITGQPVKMLFDRRDTFFGESGDISISDFKVGFKNDGTITAVKMKNIFAVYLAATGIDHFVDNTRIVNMACEATPVDVSIGPAWWARCEHLTSCFSLTLVFDHVAAALGMDPIEVALKNDGTHGHDTGYLDQYKREHGFPDRDSLKECIDVGSQAIGWKEKWHLPGTRKLTNGKLHGIAFTWDHNWDDTRGTGSAAVMIENDGSITIIGQHVDIGPNPWTPLCQIVADEIGVPFESVHIKPWTVDTGFVLMSPDGSCNLVTNGNIVRKAAHKAKQMLLELAAEKFEVASPEELDIRDGVIFLKADPANSKPVREIVARALPVHVSGAFWTQPPIIGWAWHNQGIWGQANETERPRLCRQAHFMEVEVDPDTGQVEVTHVVNVNDVGKAVSPEGVEGQMYGGTVMGVSRGTIEEMIWDPQTGVLLNGSLLDYKYATILDCGPIDTPFIETGLGHGPYGASGIGEATATIIPALLGPAVYNAIGHWVDDFPITPDKVLKALGKIQQCSDE
jgi:xanthine dehydrogenase molybdenum-binding subunit